MDTGRRPVRIQPVEATVKLSLSGDGGPVVTILGPGGEPKAKVAGVGRERGRVVIPVRPEHGAVYYEIARAD